MCRIERPFARTLNGQAPPRYSLWIPSLCGTTWVWHVPPLSFGHFPRERGKPRVVRGRASAVWLAFVGGASVCPASEPCSYNGLNNRVSAAFRPSSQTSLTTCGGHRRRAVCWRPRVVPLAAVLYSIFCSVFERLSSTFLDAAILLFRALTRWPSDQRIVVVIQHMLWICQVFGI